MRITALKVNDWINKAGGVKAFLKQAKAMIKKDTDFFDSNYQELYAALCTHPIERGYHQEGAERISSYTVATDAFPVLLEERLEIVSREKYQLAPLDLGNAFTERPSRKRSGKIHQLNSMRKIQEVRETETYPEAALTETSDTYTNRKFGEILKISEETILFDDLGEIIEAAGEMADDMKVFEEGKRAEVLLNDANFDLTDALLGKPNDIAITLAEGLTAKNLEKVMQLGANMVKPNGAAATIRSDFLIVGVIDQVKAGQVLAQAFNDDSSALQQKPVGFRFLGMPSPMVSAALDQAGSIDFFTAARGAFLETVAIPTQFSTMRGQMTDSGWRNDIVAEFKIRFLKGFTAKDKRRMFRGNLT